MSDGDPPQAHLGMNFEVSAGDPVDIFEKPYLFDRIDSDGAVTFRAPLVADGSRNADFMIVGADGHARKPTCDEVGILHQEGNLIFRQRPLATDARRRARAMELDVQQCRELDRRSPFRTAVLRRFDLSPWSKSDRSLNAFMKDAMDDPAIRALDGAKIVCAATLRTWIRERGTPDCRKTRDGISMTGRKPKLSKIAHPLEILMYWAVRSTNVRGDIIANHDRYSADITRINRGQPLDRNLLIDPEDDEARCERPAAYPIPKTPYVPVSYISFYRLNRKLKSARALRSKVGAKAEYQKYGGAGISDIPRHLGALCWIDETTVPKVFFVDDETGIPIGQVTISMMLENMSKTAAGWTLNPGGPSASSIMKTVLHANARKNVPKELLKIDANLPWLRLKPSWIGFDNSSAAHARSVEDFLGEAYIGTRFVGKEMPRDKAPMERVLGIFLRLIFKEMADASYDIARMRLFFPEFDPERQVICSMKTGRRLLDLAAMIYNVSKPKRGMKLPPALVWKQQLGHRKLDVIRDEDEFRRSIGKIDHIQMNNAGIEKFGRYYKPGAMNHKRILQDFERGLRLAKGDTAPKPRANIDDRKRLTFDVKIKWDEDDIGIIRVWNPHAQPSPKWEDFFCGDPEAYGMPEWLHDRCVTFAKAQSLEYITPEQQSYVRALLFEEIANVDSAAAELERRTLARAVDDPNVARVFSQYVEIRDEDIDADVEAPEPEEHSPVTHRSAVGHRKDAADRTPRAKSPSASKPVTMKRPATPPKVRASSPAPRRTGHTTSTNAAPRDSRAHTKSAERPDQRAPARARSRRMKYGDEF